MAKISKKSFQLLEDFLANWKVLYNYLKETLAKGSTTMEEEKTFLQLTGKMARDLPVLTRDFNLDSRTIDQVMDFLQYTYSLRVVVDFNELQVSMLREKWNDVLIELNRLSTQ
jgi:hypothetical protein